MLQELEQGFKLALGGELAGLDKARKPTLLIWGKEGGLRQTSQVTRNPVVVIHQIGSPASVWRVPASQRVPRTRRTDSPEVQASCHWLAGGRGAWTLPLLTPKTTPLFLVRRHPNPRLCGCAGKSTYTHPTSGPRWSIVREVGARDE